ncbi:hypothetical protein [Thauera butanivorans]|uniref:hypothetical protein n=1 Tax=Thauera butanivorans TaxID=86174 RepID=UPI0012FCD4D8|nr:hypothetical protein [Thauera butanivorans]
MAKQLDDVATLELPIEAPKRGRGRPSTGKARSSAERMRELRERQRTAVWGADEEARDIPVTVTGMIEQLRYAVANGYVAVARHLSDRLLKMAMENKLRNSDGK